MDADLGISKWAIVALVVAMIAVGTMGLVLSGGGAAQEPGANQAPANGSAQSH